MAPGFLLGGGLEWPRELAWLLGSLTVGLTYFLGASVARCQWEKEVDGDPGDIDNPGDIDAAARWTAERWAGLLAALLPPTFAAIGCLLVGIPRRGARHHLGHHLGRLAVPATRFLTLALTLCLLAYPLHRLRSFYAAENEAGRSNARLWQIVHGLDGVATDADPVYLDRELRHLRLTAGGNLLLVPDSMMDLQDMPHVKVKQSEQPELPAGAIIVLSQGQADALCQGRRLDTVDLGAPLVPAAPGEYGVYRMGPPAR
jgi:hypothetical protein